jgi:hypothetical protein
MKHDELRSVAHNLADSLASGIGLLIGVYEMDVFGEAGRSPGGSILVDLLRGTVVEGKPSASLRRAIALYGDALPSLCASHGGSVEDFRELKVRYWYSRTERRFDVTVEDSAARRSTTEYAGVPGKRVKILDAQGRLRPKAHSG